MSRIEQQHSAGFVSDSGEILKMPMRPERRVAVRVVFACENQADGILQQLAKPGAALGKF